MPPATLVSDGENQGTHSQVTVTNVSAATPDIVTSAADVSSTITKEGYTLKKPNKSGSVKPPVNEDIASVQTQQKAYTHVRSKTERDPLKQAQPREFDQNFDHVMGSNLQSGSYVLEQDGTGHEAVVGANAAKNLPLKLNPKRQARNAHEQRSSQREKGKKTAEATSRNAGAGSKHSATEDLGSLSPRAKMTAEAARSSTVQNSQYHTQLNNCSIIMINKNYGPYESVRPPYDSVRSNSKIPAKPTTGRRPQPHETLSPQPSLDHRREKDNTQ